MADPTWTTVADFARRLDEREKEAETERKVWLNIIALLPFGVPVDKTIKIPLQRTAPDRVVDLWPRAVIQDRAPSRFIDTRNT